MADEEQPTSAIDALSDAEYDERVGAAIGKLMDAIEAAMESEDELESDILYAAAPTALRNMLAQLIAEQCFQQPRPFKLVKELVRDLELERLSLSLLKDLQADAADAE